MYKSNAYTTAVLRCILVLYCVTPYTILSTWYLSNKKINCKTVINLNSKNSCTHGVWNNYQHTMYIIIYTVYTIKYANNKQWLITLRTLKKTLWKNHNVIFCQWVN